MSRIHEVIHRYEACRSVWRNGVEIIAVGDPPGKALNSAVRRALAHLDENNLDVWQGLLRAANWLRWRRMMQPQPNGHIANLKEGVSAVQKEADLLRNLVNDVSLIDRIATAAELIECADSPIGAELLRAINKIGSKNGIFIASNYPARVGLQEWLGDFGLTVVVPSEFDCLPGQVDHSFVIGAPSFFPASLVTAPATEAITFVMPTWFANRSIPQSSLASHAEGGITIAAKLQIVGDDQEPQIVSEPLPVEDSFFPRPVWGSRKSEEREPLNDEVEAWKILLGGGIGIWLDDGERIRSLDPRQPEGDRISYEAVRDVQPGAYLVLREGATERGAMYEAAVSTVGARAPSIADTQERWKRALADRLQRDGEGKVVSELVARQVRSASRVRAWIEPTLICPKREENLAIILDWLGIDREPSYTNALTLRRALYRAIADLRQELEVAVAKSDVSALERDGFMRLDLKRDGFRSMVVARVMARAPFTEIVPRNQARIPFKDKDAQWLE